MAILKAHGECWAEMIVTTCQTEPGVDADAMTLAIRVVRRAMSSGIVLKRIDIRTDYGTGGNVRWRAGHWKVEGRVKQEIKMDRDAVRRAMHVWAERLCARGVDAEITQ